LDEYLKSHLAVDFVECQHDSANSKQVWSALAALAILFVLVCSSVGAETRDEGRSLMEDGRRMMENGRWKMEDGRWNATTVDHD